MDLPAKKSLGQHFLTSRHVLEQIISASKIQKGEYILEIGPGTGILTRSLLEAGANVLAIEKDNRAIDLLREKFSNECQNGQLSVIEGDILDKTFNFIDLFSDFKRNNPYSEPKYGNNSVKRANYSIVSNIPYYITGAILEKFLEHEPRPNRMILLVQKEVADRIVSRSSTDIEKGNRKESILSISVKAFGEPYFIAKVPRGAFSPPPNVDSAILTIENISDHHFKENNVDINDFFSILKAGFAHKRKFALNNITERIPDIEKIENIRKTWSDLKLDNKIRAEKISLSDWFLIASKIS